jgi:cellobiose transport system permease protein
MTTSRLSTADRPPVPATTRDVKARPSGRGTGFDMKFSPYLFVLPFFIVFGIFGLFPALYTFYVSMFDWTLGDAANKTFVGLGNYTELMRDDAFWNATYNTVGIFVIGTVPQILMALALAQVLNSRLRARTFFRMGVLLPNITSIAAVAIIFSQLFARDFGIINYLFGFVGAEPVDWQANRWSSWLAIATMVDWRWTGYNALIFLAALQAVPHELYESASIDGAGRARQFWSITIPVLRPTLIFVVIISTIGGIQLFAEPLLFDVNPANASGGASGEFQTLALYLYQNGFKLFEFGYAAAIGWVMFLIVCIFVVINYVVTRRISGSR